MTKQQLYDMLKSAGIYTVLRVVELLITHIKCRVEVDFDLEENDIGIDSGSEEI